MLSKRKPKKQSQNETWLWEGMKDNGKGKYTHKINGCFLSIDSLKQ